MAVSFQIFQKIERASDSLKTDVTKKLISQELKHISPICKKHWKAYLILL